MKKRRVTALIAAIGILAAGCGQQSKTGTWGADENSIYVNHALEVESALIYTSDIANDTYNQEELKAFVEEAVAAYNTENGGDVSEKPPVALTSCKLEGQTGTLVFEYATGADFVKFSEESGDNSHTVTDLSVQRIADAGGLEGVDFLSMEGKPVEIGEVLKQTDYYVVSVTGAATICTEGQAVYTTEGVTLRDSFTMTTPEGTSYIVFK